MVTAELEEQEETTEASRPGRKPKTKFIDSEFAKTLMNEQGRLVGVPPVISVRSDGEGYCPKLQTPPKTSDFENDYDHMRFQAAVCDYRSELEFKKAEKLRSRADICEKMPDPSKRNAIKKLQAMREKMDALQEELIAQGINVEDV